MNTDAKTPSKKLTNRIQEHIKEIIYYDQVSSSQKGNADSHTYINRYNTPYNEFMDKTHIIILIFDKKATDKIHYIFMIKFWRY